MTAPHVDYAIVGGGLSGLATALTLTRRAKTFALFEARDRLGGRAWSRVIGGSPHRYDVGPAWVWPGQPRIAALIDQLGLTRFEQFSRGNLVFEDERGRVRRDLEFSTMAGALRIDGGLASLIDRLAARLDATSLHTGRPVRELRQADDHVEVRLGDDVVGCTAGVVVVAVPPRIAANIEFAPGLAAPQLQALRAIPTWMAGHAKFLAIYPTPFWRAAGLSGDAMSRRGPLAEIHDASPPDGSAGALFGFLGVPANARANARAELKTLATQQLASLFGGAETPDATELIDWATETFTATAADATPPSGHPDYGLPPSVAGVWNGRLRFASTEVATPNGGLLEGALEAAAAALEPEG